MNDILQMACLLVFGMKLCISVAFVCCFECIFHSHTSGCVYSATLLVCFLSGGQRVGLPRDLHWLFPRPDCNNSPRACTINSALEYCFLLLLFFLALLSFIFFSLSLNFHNQLETPKYAPSPPVNPVSALSHVYLLGVIAH